MYTEQQQYPEVDTSKVYYLGSDAVYLSADGESFVYKVTYDLGAEGHVWPITALIKPLLTEALPAHD